MTLPVQACSDEELEGYAGICPEAAVELARRIAAGQTDFDAEIEELQSHLREAESELDDLKDQRHATKRLVNKELDLLRALLGDHEISDDLRTAITTWAKRLEDRI